MHQTFRALALVTGALVVLGATPTSAQQVTLRFANWVPPTHQMTGNQTKWYQMIEQYSNGGIKVEFDKAAVGKPEGQYEVVSNGVRDIDWHIPGYTPGRQELIRVPEGPFLSPSATITSPILWKWYAKHGLASKEFSDVKLLTVWVSGGSLIHTRKEVKTLKEIKDLKMRGAGGTVASAKALGMSVVSFPMTDAFDALQRGTIDGILGNFEAIPSFNMTDMLPYHLVVPGSLACTSMTMLMNKRTYDGLSASNRAAVDKASGEAGAEFYGKAWDAADIVARKLFNDKKHTFNTVSGDELAQWRKLLAFVRADWVKTATSKGVDGEALMKDFEAMIAAAPKG